MRRIGRTTAILALLTVALTSPIPAQTAWPCPQNITPADLGYDAEITFQSKQFLVWSLILLVTGPDPARPSLYSGIYNTFPGTPTDLSGQWMWTYAAVHATCQRIPWINPATGTLTGLIVVQEESKTGIVVDRRIVCGEEGGSGGTGVVSSVEDDEYDPYAESGGNDQYSDACDGSAGTGSGGGGELGGGSGSGGQPVCGGSSTLVWEAICIDIWVEGVGWVEWWCGVAAICG